MSQRCGAGRVIPSLSGSASSISIASSIPLDPASLMLNSSHGIGPDLSRSGLNGPSIYPVTATGLSVTWVKSNIWTFRLGVFDGVAGSPRRPQAFLAERLKPSDGVFVIGQADWQLTKSSRIEAGSWGYTAAQDGPGGRKANDRRRLYSRMKRRSQFFLIWASVASAGPASDKLS